MRLHIRILVLVFVISTGQVFCSNPCTNNESILKARKIIKENHHGVKPVRNIVKVVYFHGKDLAPLPNWEERLSRTLDDVSNYYKEEFNKHGLIIDGIPFERNKGKIVFHVVEGDSVSKSYGISSGLVIQKEIQAKTDGKIDFSRDHVLVINGLCFKRKDGTYVFHAPYYGFWIGASKGVCHVADCELLDSKLLTDTIHRMAFSEMTIDYKECSVAEFNSWYIGGIAHEMGHLFGLPHDYGNPSELDNANISLMGDMGSRHYRDYLWGGEKSSVFSTASVLQLMSHPVFAGTEKPDNVNIDLDLSELRFVPKQNGMNLYARFQTKDQPYGAVALIHSLSQSEYFNRSYSAVISNSDSICMDFGPMETGNYVLRLMFLFPDGNIWQSPYNIVKVDKEGNVTLINPFVAFRPVNVQKFYEELQKSEKTPENDVKLEILRGILNPAEPIDPKTFDGSRLSLSEAKWKDASVGWGKVARNYFSCDAEYNFFLELQGKLYSKGLYAHSASSYLFDLNRRWKTFTAIVGLRDNAHSQGSARFTVIGDGKVLYESSALRVNQKEEIKVDVSNVMILKLQTDGTEGHIHNSWAIWVDPIIER